MSLCGRVVPEATLRLSDSLDGLTGLREALLLLITAHYSQRMPISQQRQRMHGQSLGETGHRLPGVPSQECHTILCI